MHLLGCFFPVDLGRSRTLLRFLLKKNELPKPFHSRESKDGVFSRLSETTDISGGKLQGLGRFISYCVENSSRVMFFFGTEGWRG